MIVRGNRVGFTLFPYIVCRSEIGAKATGMGPTLKLFFKHSEPPKNSKAPRIYLPIRTKSAAPPAAKYTSHRIEPEKHRPVNSIFSRFRELDITASSGMTRSTDGAGCR